MAVSRNQRLKMLKDISAAHLQLRKLISSLSDEELLRPETAGAWSAKNLIAHLADWEGLLLAVIQDREAGRPESWPIADGDMQGLDAWNNAQVIARADWSLEDVQEYFDQTHADLMEVLEKSQNVDPAEAIMYTKTHYSKHQPDLLASRTTPGA